MEDGRAKKRVMQGKIIIKYLKIGKLQHEIK